MRLYEFDGTTDLTGRLLAVLNYLRTKHEEVGKPPKISTQSLINLVKNAGAPQFNYQSIVDAHKSNPAVKTLIKNFNEKTIDLSSDSDIGVSGEVSGSEETVDTMAKRALGRTS